MTGIYMRVLRDGKWQSIELEHMTDAERAEMLKDGLTRLMFLNALCKWLTENIEERSP